MALLLPVALLVVCWAVPPCVVFAGVSCALLWCGVLLCLCCVGLWCVPLSFGHWLVSGVAPWFSLPFCIGLGCFCPSLLCALVFWWRVLSLVSLSGPLPCCVLWFVVVTCFPPLCPVASYVRVVPCCGALVPFLFRWRCLFLFAAFFFLCKIQSALTAFTAEGWL